MRLLLLFLWYLVPPTQLFLHKLHKKLKKLKINNPPRSSWPDGGLGGRLAGWLAGWLRFLKESLRNPIRILMNSSQPAMLASQEHVGRSYTNPSGIQCDSYRWGTPNWPCLPGCLPGRGGVGGSFVFLIVLILLMFVMFFLIIRAMFRGSLWVVFSFTFAVICTENYEIIKTISTIFFKPGDLKNIGNHNK